MIYHSVSEAKKKGKKQLAVLVDPDELSAGELLNAVDKAVLAGVGYFFVGGSLVVSENLGECIKIIKSNSDIPVVIFPGSALQISNLADGILFLSLISGRNPELLIGQHVVAAPHLKATGLEIMPCGYMLIDGGRLTTATYMSNSLPIPADKNDLAVSTALAGEMLGLKLIYMDTGSGAKRPVGEEMISKVSENVSLPLIVGGGIDSGEKAGRVARAGADIIVVGNAIEKNPELINELADAILTPENETHNNI